MYRNRLSGNCRDYPGVVPGHPALYISFAAMLFNSSLHLDKQTLSFAVVSVILNFVLNLFFIPRWGAIGAAWSTLVTESLFSVCMVVLLTSNLHARAIPDLPRNSIS